MSLSEEKNMKMREFAFYCALVVGLIYLFMGKHEWDFSFGIMWIFIAFFNAMRYRYRKHPFTWWGPELMEGLTLVAFWIIGYYLGLAFFYPLGIAIGSIFSSFVWFVFWRLWLEEYLYRFWR